MVRNRQVIATTTRMHSSRMRTGRSLTVCWSLLPGGVCVSAPGGVSALGGFLPWGVSAPGGMSAPRGVSAPRGGICSWGVGVCSGGCLLLGGMSAPRGVCIPACTEADTPC